MYIDSIHITKHISPTTHYTYIYIYIYTHTLHTLQIYRNYIYIYIYIHSMQITKYIYLLQHVIRGPGKQAKK